MNETSLNENRAREEICRVGRSLFERGYVHATAGNISVRLDDGFLITPTDACLGFLEPEALAKVNAAGEQVSGQQASKTLVLHRRIYEAALKTGQNTRCVIHTHSTHLVALSLQAPSIEGQQSISGWSELLPPITPYFVMKVGHVPLLPYHRPGAPEVAELAAQAIAAYAAKGLALHALMLSRLGPNVWHESPAAAMATLEELEETAKLMVLRPQTQPLNDEAIEQLRQQFKASW
jgi:3-dehydro-4-phosphotetronate decarboxylase